MLGFSLFFNTICCILGLGVLFADVIHFFYNNTTKRSHLRWVFHCFSIHQLSPLIPSCCVVIALLMSASFRLELNFLRGFRLTNSRSTDYDSAKLPRPK